MKRFVSVETVDSGHFRLSSSPLWSTTQENPKLYRVRNRLHKQQLGNIQKSRRFSFQFLRLTPNLHGQNPVKVASYIARQFRELLPERSKGSAQNQWKF